MHTHKYQLYAKCNFELGKKVAHASDIIAIAFPFVIVVVSVFVVVVILIAVVVGQIYFREPGACITTISHMNLWYVASCVLASLVHFRQCSFTC